MSKLCIFNEITVIKLRGKNRTDFNNKNKNLIFSELPKLGFSPTKRCVNRERKIPKAIPALTQILEGNWVYKGQKNYLGNHV